jgi:hypothetical protein
MLWNSQEKEYGPPDIAFSVKLRGMRSRSDALLEPAFSKRRTETDRGRPHRARDAFAGGHIPLRPPCA